MLLSKICIRRPVFASVLSLVIVTLGMIFFTKLQIRGIPDIDPPIITVSSNYEGANALYMEKEVTTRIEKALKTVKNLDFISSISEVGSSNITLSFKLSTNIEVALNDVRSKVSDIVNILPQDMKAPSVSKLDSDNFPSIWISVNSDKYDELELTKLAEDNIKTVLEKLGVVGRVMMYGSRYYSMRIEPDPIKMYQYKISPIEVEDAIRKQNKDYPAGSIKTKSRNFILRLNGALSNPEEFGNIILRADNSKVLKLQDIAKVYLGPVEEDVILRYNGKRSRAIGVIKQSKSNILDLSEEVRAELNKIKKTLPQGVKIEIAYDGALPVSASIKAVFRTIFEALILVVAVTYLFLASAKITIIPLVTIPVSLIGTFSVMYLLGFSVNTFTLLAMILAIGLVVDDAIVMLENIFRHCELGQSPKEAAITASGEISFAIIAMTITLASVFLPIGFIGGFIGKLFIEFAWTLAFCVLFSGFVALTLTPMMASKMIKKTDKPQTGFLAKFDQYVSLIQAKYLYYLNLAFDNKRRFLLIVSQSIVILVISFVFINKAFVPEEDDGFLQVSFSGPEGSSYKQSEKVVIEAEQILNSHKDILGFFEVIGWGGGDSAFAFVPLKDWSIRSKSQEQIRNELNQKFWLIPGMSIFAMSPRSLASGGANHPIEFNLQTSLEYEQIDKISQEFLNQLKISPIFQNVEREFKSSTPTLDIIVNREKAYIYGVSLDNIGTTVQYLVAGRQVGDFRMGNDIYEIILQYNKDNRNKVSDLRKILVKKTPSPSSLQVRLDGSLLSEELVPLEVVANIAEKITVKSYSHYNNWKSIGFSADLAPGHEITDAIKEINIVTQKLIDRNTTKLEYLGEIKRMQESESSMLVTFLFALIFIYLVLSAQFESFSDPLIILLSVPFSITGGVFALLIFGNTLNMYSNIGLVTLVGLITKNSIMIVEFANQLKDQGLRVREAVTKAANLRLRPILMTTLATIFGAVPLVFASGAGSASRNSIGLVIIGGMIVGTAFTVFVIPVLYQTFKKV